MVCSLAEAYHWSLSDIFSLTMPQIIMLNHAAHINGKRFEDRMERRQGTTRDSSGETKTVSLNPLKDKYGEDPLIDGKTRLSEISSDFDKLRRYLTF